MLSFNYRNNEELIKEIYNGSIQQSIYEYLEELEEDNLLYPQMYDNDLSKERICEYFDAQIGESYISWEQIHDPKQPLEILLNSIIKSVYDRWSTYGRNQIDEK